MSKLIVPEWLKLASPNAMINSKEFSALLGIKLNTFHHRVAQGNIPQPDCDAHKMKEETAHKNPIASQRLTYRGCAINPKSFWKAKTVRDYIRSINAENQR